MRMRHVAGAGAIFCGAGALALGLMLGARVDSVLLTIAGVVCAVQGRGVSRSTFAAQKRALAAELAVLALALPLMRSEPAAAVVACVSVLSALTLLFSRTAAGPDTFAAGEIHWRTGTVMTLLARLPERTTTGVEAFVGRSTARRQLI